MNNTSPAVYVDERQMRLFFDRVETSEGCWIWRGPIGKTGGYAGRVMFITPIYAGPPRRWLWELLTQTPLQRRYIVKNCCENPLCVAPMHLKLRTTTDREPAMRKAYSQLSEETAKEAGEMWLRGYTTKQISEYLGVTQRAIQQLLTGTTWKDLDIGFKRPLVMKKGAAPGKRF